MEFGQPIKRPPINSKSRPGSWTPLHQKSSFILSSLSAALDNITKLGVDLPEDLSVNLYEAGGQIVSGVNTYLEFTILHPALNVQVLAYTPAFGERQVTIRDIYITSKKIF